MLGENGDGAGINSAAWMLALSNRFAQLAGYIDHMPFEVGVDIHAVFYRAERMQYGRMRPTEGSRDIR